MKGCGIQDIIKILNLTSNLKSRLLLFGYLCGGRKGGKERGCTMNVLWPQNDWLSPRGLVSSTSALALNTLG